MRQGIHIFKKVFKDYLVGAKELVLEDPYIRREHQVVNFVRFCELVAKVGDAQKMKLITWYDDEDQKKENELKRFDPLMTSLFENDITLEIDYKNPKEMHDRYLRLSNGWTIKMGKGLDYFQNLGGNYFQLGANDQDLRTCVQTSFDFYRE